jgi:predicted glycosyltransferase
VPRIVPRTEQFIRAQAFENLGLLRGIRPDQLNVTNLRAEIGHALKQSRQELLARAQKQLSFDGARQAARRLLALANDRSETALDARGVCSPPMLEVVGAASNILASTSRPQ